MQARHQARGCRSFSLHALPGTPRGPVVRNSASHDDNTYGYCASDSGSPTNVILPAPSAIAIRLAPIMLSLERVKAMMERLPVRSVNLGTGGTGVHPDYKQILAYLRTNTVPLHHHFQW